MDFLDYKGKGSFAICKKYFVKISYKYKAKCCYPKKKFFLY